MGHTAVITSPGLVAQELRKRAEAIRRESRLRGNGGEALAEYRQRLRKKADELDAVAESIDEQMRAKHYAQGEGLRRLERLHRGRS